MQSSQEKPRLTYKSKENPDKPRHRHKRKRKVPPVESHHSIPSRLNSQGRQIKQEWQQQQAQYQKEYDRQIYKYCEQRHKGQKRELNDMVRWEIICQLFVFHEYFMPNCDILYFSTNSMSDIYNELSYEPNYHSDSKQKQFPSKNLITLKHYKNLQKALPKPAKFTFNFIRKQRKVLNQNRIKKRNKNIDQKQSKNLSIFNHLNQHIKVGHQVWAFCPTCLLIHSGSVLSQYKDSYLINFDEPSFGSLKVPQYYVTAELKQLKQSRYMQRTNALPTQALKGEQKTMVKQEKQKIDIQALSIYIELMELKKEFIKKLRQYNNMAENVTRQSLSVSNSMDVMVLTLAQIQEYGWIGTVINMITVLLRYIDSSYCVRLPNSMGWGQKNIKSSRLPILSLSETYSNMNTNNSQQQQQKGENKSKQRVEQYQEQSQQREMQQSIKLCIGVLKNVEKKGKQYKIQEDNSPKKPQQKYEKSFPAQIQQLHSRLEGITKKISN